MDELGVYTLRRRAGDNLGMNWVFILYGEGRATIWGWIGSLYFKEKGGG